MSKSETFGYFDTFHEEIVMGYFGRRNAVKDRVVLPTQPLIYSADEGDEILELKRFLPRLLEPRPPVPPVEEGQIVIYYGGWNLCELRCTAVGHRCIRLDQPEYDVMGYSEEQGYWSVVLATPGSHLWPWRDKTRLVYEAVGNGWRTAPLIVAATAFAIYLSEKKEDPLPSPGDHCICAGDGLGEDTRVALTTYYDHMKIVDDRDYDDFIDGNMYVAIAKKL